MKLSVIKKQQAKHSNISKVQNSLNQFLQNKFWDPYAFFEKPFLNSLEKIWSPEIDISETEKEMKMKVNLPNVDPDKINIEVDEDTLIISGKTEEENKEENETFYKIERKVGEFKRVCWLPSNVDKNQIHAESKNGTILISIPKKNHLPKKRISIDKK